MPRNVIDGEPLFGNEFTGIHRAALGDYVVSGAAVSVQGGASLTLDVAASTYRIGEVEYTYDATFEVLDAGGAFDRIDTVSIDENGYVTITKGTTADVAPPIPDGEVFLALAQVDASAASITDAELIDGRVLSDLVNPENIDGTDITLNQTHNQDVLFLTGTSTVTLDGSQVNDGFTCSIVNDGTGVISFTSSDTLRSEASLTDLTVQYTNAFVIWKEVDSAWYLFGALT